MLGRSQYDDLVTLFYSAATGAIPWNDALRTTADAFGSCGTLFGVHDTTMKSIVLESHSYSAEFLASFFASDIYANDPRMPHIVNVPAGSVFFDSMLYDPAQMARDPWVNASMETLRVDDELGAKLRMPNGLAVFALLRASKEGRHPPEAVAMLRRLAPHLERACALGYVLDRNAKTADAVLDALASRADGVILLDAAGQLAFVNSAAEAILRRGDGIQWRDGAFGTRRLPETQVLHRHIGDAIAAALHKGERPGGRMLVSRAGGQRPYALLVLPVPSGAKILAALAIACAIHIQDLAAAAPVPDEAMALFGLSPREADLAVALVHAGTLDKAARTARMAHNTARNHLQRIFAKTGTSGQADLVQFLSRLR